MNNVEKGRAGEKYAADYLTGLGYTVLAQNYSFRTGEIDIIADAAGVLVFVEVKLRTGKTYGYPREAVNARKQDKIRRLAQKYITEKNLHNRDVRFDVIEIIKTDRIEITHLTDAF